MTIHTKVHFTGKIHFYLTKVITEEIEVRFSDQFLLREQKD